MSKKMERNRESYLKNWTAAIAGSVCLLSMQSSQAADESRLRFRDFRASNQGVDRQMLRHLYRDQVKSRSASGQFNICPVSDAPYDSKQSNKVQLGSDKWLRAERSFVRNQSMQENATGNAIRLSSGANLDLTALSRSITLGQKLFANTGSVEIEVGGQKKTLSAGSQVTAAEYVAAKQVLAGLGQKLTLAADGSASGGEVDLGSLTSSNDVMRASNLVVPSNVTTLGDFSKGSDFRLTGGLSNYGTVYAFDADGKGRGGAIRAHDILNAAGGLIKSDTDLSLIADGDLTNLGTITSNGNLTLSAGGAVKNTSTASAQRDLNVNAPVVTNSGMLSSTNGNVNLDGPSTSTLTVNNVGGRIEALNGAVNVRNADYAGTFDTIVSGGDLLSKELNLNSGLGTVNVNVKDLTGTVNETGYAAHVYASTDVLTLGKTCLTGDPTFVNDTGSINITADVSVAENLTYIARDDITVSPNIIVKAGDAAQGHDITMIAGANITSTVGGATIDGNASTNGGSIVLGPSALILAISTSFSGDHAAGNINMYAFSGGAVGSGTVSMGSGSFLKTAGYGAGADGNVTIIAGGQNVGAQDAIKLDTIDAAGPTFLPVTGAINVVTAQPVSSGGSITYDTTGARTSVAQLIASGSLTPDAGISINNPVMANVVNLSSSDYIHSGALGSILGSSMNFSTGGNGVGQETAYLKVGAPSGALSLTATATAGDVWINYTDGNTMTLGASTGNQHFTVLASNGGSIAIGGNLGGTGTLTLNTQALTNDGSTVTFNNIIVESPSGFGLVVDGGTSGGTFTSGPTGSTNFLATNSDLTLNNTLNFTGGDVNLTVVDNAGANLLVNNGNLNGDTLNNLVMNACNLSGGGTVTNFASVTMNCSIGTIVNSIGDVNLASNFVFAGHSLAVLAFGNINSTGATLIDVSDPTGAGGNVTLMAGFTFTPTTSGQVQDTRTYTITGSNPAGGNINLGGVDINTSSGAGFNGGNLTAVANAGSTPASISLGNITADGDTAGQIRVISPGAITVGNINASSTGLVGGNLVLAVATPVFGNSIQVTDGVVSGGSFGWGAGTAGDLTIKNINMPLGNINFVGAKNFSDDIGQVAGSTLIAQNLSVEMASGFTTLGFGASSTNVDHLSAVGTGTGQLRLLNQTSDIDLEVINAPNIALQVVASGDIRIKDAVTANSIQLNSTTGNVTFPGSVGSLSAATISLSVFDTVSGGPSASITASNSLTLQSNGNVRSATFGGTIGGAFQFLTLTSLNGNIGADLAHPFVLSRNGVVNIDATALNGSIFLTTQNTAAETLDSAQSGGSVEFLATGNNGPVTINQVTAGSGNVNISVDGNNLQIAPGATISANEGDVVIRNAGLNKKTDFFNIGNGATIQAVATAAGLGNVTLTVGPVPVPVALGKTFNKKTITVHELGGTVTWGKKKWTAKTGPIDITAKGANVTFSNAYGKKNGIIGSNVTIIADPPVVTATEASTTGGARIGTGDVKLSPPLLTSRTLFGDAPESGVVKPIVPILLSNASLADTGNLRNTLTNLASCDENLLANPQSSEDDSYITSYLPVQDEVEAKLCSDLDLGVTGKAGSSVPVMAHSTCLTMREGSACFIPSKDTTVVTPKGTVKIGANAIAYVNLDDHQLSVYDLNDHHRGSVIVEVGGRVLTLSPGRHLLVTGETPKQFAEINPLESVMHRDVCRNQLTRERHVFTSEFSVPSAVQALKPLKTIMQSGDERAKRVSDGVIKTAAIIMQLSGNAAPYEFHARPKQVALKW